MIELESKLRHVIKTVAPLKVRICLTLKGWSRNDLATFYLKISNLGWSYQKGILEILAQNLYRQREKGAGVKQKSQSKSDFFSYDGSPKDVREFMGKDQVDLLHQIKELKDPQKLGVILQFVQLIQAGDSQKSMAGINQFVSFLSEKEDNRK